MSIVATVGFAVEPDKVEEFLSVLREAIPDTRKYQGCEAATVHVDQDVPGHVLLIEQWNSRGDYEAYQAWRAEGPMPGRLGAYAKAPPERSYFDPRTDV